jgi:5S rRNA maturation endonuclease (ribonuclease M5)
LIDRIGSDPVWCCEGERDADTAAQLGMVATTAAFNDWKKADLSSLKGRRCIVICDQDPAGHRLGGARTVVLRGAGALIDNEDVVWPRSAKDLTDLVGVVGPDLYEVLEELRPIPETPPRKAIRSLEERAGFYAIVPKELLAVGVTARAVFVTLDLLAGDSRVAKLSITAFAEREGIGRTQASDAFRELEGLHLIREMRRGSWRVNNSQRRPTPSSSVC